jgi:hypothetical protein
MDLSFLGTEKSHAPAKDPSLLRICVALGFLDVGARSHSIPICSREISCSLVSSLYLVAGKTRRVGSSACAGGVGVDWRLLLHAPDVPVCHLCSSSKGLAVFERQT